MLCEGGIVKLNTEVYGGPIMSTWFDRPLTLAGRVIVKGENAMNPQTLLLHVKRPLLQISNLAIHFNRQVNDGVKLSKQKEQQDAINADRAGQVGTGDRSEKIRTYNFPQDRCTDHRIGLTVHNLDKIMDGNLDDIIDALATREQAEKLQKLNA